MKSELLLQYLGYLAIALFCGYFIYIVLKVQSDYMFDSVAGVESFVGGSLIEGMKVTEDEKKSYEKGTQNVVSLFTYFTILNLDLNKVGFVMHFLTL